MAQRNALFNTLVVEPDSQCVIPLLVFHAVAQIWCSSESHTAKLDDVSHDSSSIIKNIEPQIQDDKDLIYGFCQEIAKILDCEMPLCIMDLCYMYFSELPDPDLILRTSGEKRISNFLLWQLAYSELYFSDVFWPAFSKRDFLKAIRTCQQRKRRFGK